MDQRQYMATDDRLGARNTRVVQLPCKCSTTAAGMFFMVGLAVPPLGGIVYVPCMITVVTPVLYGINATEVTLPRKYSHGPSPFSNVATAVVGIRTPPNSR